MELPRVLGIAGSLRAGSYNRILLEAATDALPEVDWTIARLRSVPPYDADVEARGLPPAVRQLKDQVADADAIVIATPNYNRSMPGVLKNALDWASRPAMASPLVDKPVLMMGASPGRGGALRAIEDLRQVLLATLAKPLDAVVSVPGVRHRLINGQPDAELREELRDALAQLPVKRLAAVG